VWGFYLGIYALREADSGCDLCRMVAARVCVERLVCIYLRFVGFSPACRYLPSKYLKTVSISKIWSLSTAGKQPKIRGRVIEIQRISQKKEEKKRQVGS